MNNTVKNKFFAVIASVVLSLCMFVGIIAMPAVGVSAAELTQAFYFAAMGMLQWSDVGAASYVVELYKEGETEKLGDWGCSENYLPAAYIIPYSGNFYFTVYAHNANGAINGSKTSGVFTYTDQTPPTLQWFGDSVRESETSATVRFDNFDRMSACTYYYAVVDSGAAEPTVDVTGKGISAVAGSENYIRLTDLTAGAKDIYLVLKDQDGNASSPIKTTIPAYEGEEETELTAFLVETRRLSPTSAAMITYSNVAGTFYYTYSNVLNLDVAPSLSGNTWYEFACGTDETETILTNIPTDAKMLWYYFVDGDGNSTFNSMVEDYSWWSITEEYMFPDNYEITGGGTVKLTSNVPLTEVYAYQRFYGDESDEVIELTVTGSGTSWQAVIPDVTAEFIFEGITSDGAYLSCVVKAKESASVGSSFEWDNFIFRVTDSENKCVELIGVVDKNALEGKITVPAKVSYGKFSYSVEVIREGAFDYCVNMSEVVIQNGVMLIRRSAFNGCMGLTSVTIPASVQNIYSYAFSNCENLKSVKIEDSEKDPSQLKFIKDHAFSNCFSLEEINLPDNLKNIEAAAFENCKSLKEIVIPASVNYIHDDTFSYGCTSLKKVTIFYYEKLPTLGESTFPDGAEITYYKLLATPANLSWDGLVADWDAVEGATQYLVTFANEEYELDSATVSVTRYDFSDIYIRHGGNYFFTVTAKCDGGQSKTATSSVKFLIGNIQTEDRVVVGAGYIPDYSGTGVVSGNEIYFAGGELPDSLNLTAIEGATSAVADVEDLAAHNSFGVNFSNGLGVQYGEDAFGNALGGAGDAQAIKIETTFAVLNDKLSDEEVKVIVDRWINDWVLGVADKDSLLAEMVSYNLEDLARLEKQVRAQGSIKSESRVARKRAAKEIVKLFHYAEKTVMKNYRLGRNEDAAATFSVNTYGITQSGEQNYISVSGTMQFTMQMGTDNLPGLEKLKLFRLNDDGTRTQMKVISVSNGVVVGETAGNSTYVLVYEFDGGLSTLEIVCIVAACLVLAAAATVATVMVIKKRRR